MKVLANYQNVWLIELSLIVKRNKECELPNHSSLFNIDFCQ